MALKIAATLAILSLVAALLYGLLALLLTVFSSKFVYFPVRSFQATPDTAGLSYEEVFFRTEDGVDICAWFVPGAAGRSVILFCHGNAGNLSHRLDTLRVFNDMGFGCLIFDYRGFGRSGGKPTEVGTYRDAEAAWRYLVEHRQARPEQIVIFGRSLGGAVAVWLAARHRPAALVVESSFTTMPDLAAAMAPFLPVRKLLRFDYGTVNMIRDVPCPVLIIHSRDDELIPFRFGQELFAAAKEPKQFLPIRGPHNTGFLTSLEDYTAGWRSFIARYGIP